MSSEATEAWVLDVRNEFPGLLSAKSWVLCDSPGGTQFHQVKFRDGNRIFENWIYVRSLE